MIIDIKSYARQKGVSTQAVYKQISNYNDELKDHIIKEKGKRWLDDYAVEFLDRQSNASAVAVQTIEKDEAVELLKDKYIAVLEDVKQMGIELQEAKSQLALAEKSQAQLEAEKQAEREQLEREIAELKEQLEAEQNRKLTFGERFLGKKKHRD